MTNVDDKAAACPRTTVRIPTASGDELEAWLYLPEGDGPYPAVVMAHGIGAIKAGGLAPFAERFCRAGFATVVFDYRQWGGSAGQPREELSFPRQLEDYGTVIGWAAAQPRIDARRIFAWGTSSMPTSSPFGRTACVMWDTPRWRACRFPSSVGARTAAN